MAPADGSTVCTDVPLFDWHRIKGASGYRLQVDNDSRFATPAIDDGTSEGEYRPLHGLSPGTYFWRVRASNSAGEGDWSPVWRFRQAQCLHLPLVVRGAR